MTSLLTRTVTMVLMRLLAGDVVPLRCRAHAAQEPLMQSASHYVFAVSQTCNQEKNA